jgi:hypothetical protein
MGIAIPGGDFVVSGKLESSDFNPALSSAFLANLHRDLSVGWAITLRRSKPLVSGASGEHYSVWLFEEEDMFKMLWVGHDGHIVHEAGLRWRDVTGLLRSLGSALRSTYGVRGEPVGLYVLGESSQLALSKDDFAIVTSPIGIEFSESARSLLSQADSRKQTVYAVLLLSVQPEKKAVAEIILLPRGFYKRPSSLSLFMSPEVAPPGLALSGFRKAGEVEASWIGEINLGSGSPSRKHGRFATLSALGRKGYLARGFWAARQGTWTLLLAGSQRFDQNLGWLSCSSECVAIAQSEGLMQEGTPLTVRYLQWSQRLVGTPRKVGPGATAEPRASWFVPSEDAREPDQLWKVLLPAQSFLSDSVRVLLLREPKDGSLSSALRIGTDLVLIGETILTTGNVFVREERVPLRTERLLFRWEDLPVSVVNATEQIETVWDPMAYESLSLRSGVIGRFRLGPDSSLSSLLVARMGASATGGGDLSD